MEPLVLLTQPMMQTMSS
ncbi:hypothetical protein E2C01_082993 [Portunus trituberculatus]|uniref:Uncharacterized protein n=1 Tax=Portunus trituberculatus TaxID=210409 RepID=A0A5B7IRB0_PORTR|nr:hypothetical protein [Portunus trituberculatus]